MNDTTNACRADLALLAVEGFAVATRVDTARDAIADLICNLMHLARGRGLDEQYILDQAVRMAAEEAREDPEGDMEEIQSRFRELLPEDN